MTTSCKRPCILKELKVLKFSFVCNFRKATTRQIDKAWHLDNKVLWHNCILGKIFSQNWLFTWIEHLKINWQKKCTWYALYSISLKRDDLKCLRAIMVISRATVLQFSYNNCRRHLMMQALVTCCWRLAGQCRSHSLFVTASMCSWCGWGGGTKSANKSGTNWIRRLHYTMWR